MYSFWPTAKATQCVALLLGRNHLGWSAPMPGARWAGKIGAGSRGEPAPTPKASGSAAEIRRRAGCAAGRATQGPTCSLLRKRSRGRKPPLCPVPSRTKIAYRTTPKAQAQQQQRRKRRRKRGEKGKGGPGGKGEKGGVPADYV